MSPGGYGEEHRDHRKMGSTFVPLDSWVYPAFEKLIAFRLINTAMLGLKPWTRIECARQIKEAADLIAEDETQDSESQKLYSDLHQEFAPELGSLDGGENAELRLESAYTRSTEIAGKPLTGTFAGHQTWPGM